MFRKQALIGLTAFGIALGSGAAAATPVGLQSLPTFQDRATTAEPAHYSKRRHRHVRKRHFSHPRKFHRRHALRRHHYVHPRYYKRRFVHPRHFKRRHHFRRRGHFSFGFSFGR